MSEAYKSKAAYWIHRLAGLSYAVGWLALAFTVVFGAVGLVGILIEDDSKTYLPVVLDYRSEEAVQPSGESFEKATLFVQRGAIVANGGSLSAWAVLHAPMMLVVVLYLFMFHHLRRFTANLDAGKPFAADNARNLRLAGLALIATQLAEFAGGMVMNLYARSNFVVERGEIHLMPDQNLYVTLLGLLLIAVAEAFRLGAGLQQDREETI